MFLNKLSGLKCLSFKSRVICEYNRRLLYNPIFVGYSYLGTTNRLVFKSFHNKRILLLHPGVLFNVKRWHRNKILSNVSDLFNDNDNITSIFSNPRVTLNEFASRRKEKTFEIHYKQQSVSPKGRSKKNSPNNWTCTYSFIWPEKIKFESTSLSKRQAAQEAASYALEYLYKHNHIDVNGNPIYDENVINEIKETLEKPIHANISEASIERINRIWDEYNNEIKLIYDRTHKENLLDVKLVPMLQDSTLDEEEEGADSEGEEQDINEINEKTIIHPVYGRSFIQPDPLALARRQRKLTAVLNDSRRELVELPIDGFGSKITEALESSRIVIIVGEAGCGKSTRVPRTILEKYGVEANIFVSEPRRVAAIGLADRVADELMENVGQTVGYQVRLSSKLPSPPGGSILYATSGVLLRRLLNNPGLTGCTHIIIDEAHERDINTDVILLLVKKALEVNPQLKLILMSATLNIKVFTSYFNDSPVIEVPGRTFPVESTYLEELPDRYPGLDVSKTLNKYSRYCDKPFIYCNEVVNIIREIDKHEREGAILVFLPGWAEIRNIKNMLGDLYQNSNRHLIIPVHSRLTNTEQCQMFNKPPPGTRKIVLCTNIAETSLTIPDVVFVLDCGAHRENRVMPQTGSSSLQCVWTSLSAAKQRAGRAGRMQPGHCFKMYTRDIESYFLSHNTPEILRVPLEQTALQCKTYSPEHSIEHFLAQLPEPPTDRSIQYAIQDLKNIGALTEDQQLTRVGVLLSQLTLAPRLARMLLLSSALCSVVNISNIITYIAIAGEMFSDAGDRSQEIREIKREFDETSDHVALHNILTEFERKLSSGGKMAAEKYCTKYGLRVDRLQYHRAISSVYLSQLLNTNIIDLEEETDDLNKFSQFGELTKLIILAGSNKLLFSRKHLKTRGQLDITKIVTTSTGDKAHITVDSVNYLNKNSLKSDVGFYTYYGGYHSVERRALVLHSTSLITPQIALLSAQDDIRMDTIENSDDEVVLVLPKHKLRIYMKSSEADVIMKTREMLWSTFNYYLQRNMTDENNVQTSRFRIRLVKAICKILNESAKDYYNVNTNLEQV